MSSPLPAIFSMYAPSVHTTSLTSGLIFPCKLSITSIASRVFPTLLPKGSSILVRTQIVSFPAKAPIVFICFESSIASSFDFIKAPLPTITSNTILLAPLAIFLLIILDAIKGILSTQEIASLSAYIFLSAGAKFNVCPIKLIPISFTFCLNSSMPIPILYPGIDSSLSAVPPLNPKTSS